MMVKSLLPLSLLFVVFSGAAQAKTLWSDYSLTYLKGDNYEVGDNKREVITFEYSSGTTWGDTFMFFDRLESDNGDTETYGEFSPRFKISDLEASFMKNLYVATTIEIGDGFTNYLYGLGTDLVVPGFNFFQLNAYRRNNDAGDGSYQLTAAWAVPIGPLMYDGFMDYASGVDNTAFGDTKPNMNLTSQLKYDVAPHLGLETKLYLGVEYVYWNNKFGIDGVDERNVNLLVKYHF